MQWKNGYGASGKKRGFMNIGEKIKRLRLENGLTQEELADRCELSKGFISQLERDMTSPSIASLIDILESLGTSLKDFFSEHDEKIVFSEEDFFEKEDEELGYKLEWIIPNAQKNEMEPILLTIEPDGEFEAHEPHSGEEFGYLLSGRIQLRVGGKHYNVKAGETFYYSANKEHSIVNKGKKAARLLMVSSPPNF